MVKLPLLLFMLALLYLFYPGEEKNIEDDSPICKISEEMETHSCFLRCQGYGDHWSGCCVPRKNVHEPESQMDLGKCACCQRDYSKNRDFCAALVQGDCPTLYDQSMCFYMAGADGEKRYCDANKTEMQRSIALDRANKTKNAKARKRRIVQLS